MKGPFGMLLVGGGIILLIGLFTGKITFAGVNPNGNIPGSPFNDNIPNIKSPTEQIKDPTNKNNGQRVGNPGCPPNWLWDPINKKCFTPGGLMR